METSSTDWTSGAWGWSLTAVAAAGLTLRSQSKKFMLPGPSRRSAGAFGQSMG